MTEQRDNGMDERETAGASSELLTFGRFSFDTSACRLSRDGEDVHLTPKAAAVLGLLLQRPGELIGKDEFLETVWEGVFVREESLTQAISVIRQTLGDSAQTPRYIQTVSGEGYRFIGEVAEGVATTTRQQTSGQAVAGLPDDRAPLSAFPRDPMPPSPRRAPWMLIGAGLAVVSLVAAAWLLGPPGDVPRTMSTDADLSDTPQITPMTSSPENEHQPALSPDGRWLAFIRDGVDGDPPSLWVRLVDGDVPQMASSGESGTNSPAWSPRSDRIAFIRHVVGTDLDAIMSVSPLGNDERTHCTLTRVAHTGGLSWSPDGERLALVMRKPIEGPLRIYLLTLETCDATPLTDPPAEWNGDAFPRFSPDGRRVAFRRREQLPTVEHIYVVGTNGGDLTEVTSDAYQLAGLDWTADGQSIIYSDFRPGRSNEWGLWRIPARARSQPEFVGVTEGARWPTIARSADRLAYVNEQSTADIQRVPGPASAEPDGVGQPWCSSNRLEYHPHYSDDGRQIALISHRSGNAEVWVCKADGSQQPRRITFSPDLVEMPRWAPGNERLAYSARDPEVGTFDIWIVGADGADPHRITADPADERGPYWSRDGRWLYFSSGRDGRNDIWKQLIEDGVPLGEPVKVTTNGGEWARESFDGEYVYFTKPPANGQAVYGIWRIPVGGGDEEKVVANAWGNNWAMLRDGIVYELVPRNGPEVFELFDFTTGTTRRVASADGIRWGNAYLGVAVSPDLRWILYTSGFTISDLNLVEPFR